MYMYMIMVLWL